MSGFHSEQLGNKTVSEDTEMAVDALDSSCMFKSTAPDAAGAKGQFLQIYRVWSELKLFTRFYLKI